MHGFLLKYIMLGGAFAALVLGVYLTHLRFENLKLHLEAEKKRAEAYAETLQSYQDAFKDQVRALNTERQQEIKRQEHLLRTLNLIGDLNEKDNTTVPESSISVIDSLYADSLRPPAR